MERFFHGRNERFPWLKNVLSVHCGDENGEFKQGNIYTGGTSWVCAPKEIAKFSEREMYRNGESIGNIWEQV